MLRLQTPGPPRGSLPDLSVDAAREEMLAELSEAVFARSTVPTRDAVWRTLRKISEGWELGLPLPLTVQTVSAVGPLSGLTGVTQVLRTTSFV